MLIKPIIAWNPKQKLNAVNKLMETANGQNEFKFIICFFFYSFFDESLDKLCPQIRHAGNLFSRSFACSEEMANRIVRPIPLTYLGTFFSIYLNLFIYVMVGYPTHAIRIKCKFDIFIEFNRVYNIKCLHLVFCIACGN